MLKDRARGYYIDEDNNCAECALKSIRDEYGLDIAEDDMKLVSAFGGGMGCGKTCGALCGALAAYGKMAVIGKAHATEGFGGKCAELCREFEEKLGSVVCAELKPMYKTDSDRCLKTVELGLEVFEKFASENGLDR